MLALTLWRPWAWAVAHARKDIENRRWSPVLATGTELAIHAGKRWDLDGAAWIEDTLDLAVPREPDDPTGIVAVAIYRGAVRRSSSAWFVGPVGWLLSDVRPLETPVPCRGAQGIWKLPRDVEEAVMRELESQ